MSKLSLSANDRSRFLRSGTGNLVSSGPRYIEGASGTMASGVAQTVTLPTGLVDGDWMFIHHFHTTNNGNITVGSDSGWTRYSMNMGLSVCFTVFYKKYAAGQAATVNMSYNGAMKAEYHTFAYAGLDATTPINTVSPSVAVWPGSGSVTTLSAITTLDNNSTLLVLHANSDTSGPTVAGFSQIAVGTPAASRTWALFDKTQAVAGSTGTVDVTKAASSSNILFELNSA